MKRKLFTFLLALLSVFFCFTVIGCIDKDKEEKQDPLRTQLYVSNFNGGYGDEWLRTAKRRFEESQKDISYQNGRTGVQIMIENSKNAASIATMAVATQEVFFNQYKRGGFDASHSLEHSGNRTRDRRDFG